MEAYLNAKWGLGIAGLPTLAPAANLLPGRATPVTSAAGIALDLNGGSQTVASLSGRPAAGGRHGDQQFQSAAAALTLAPTGGITIFSGTITDNNGNGGGGGALSLVVNGPGTQVLAGSNGYAGGTTITGGATCADLRERQSGRQHRRPDAQQRDAADHRRQRGRYQPRDHPGRWRRHAGHYQHQRLAARSSPAKSPVPAR